MAKKAKTKKAKKPARRYDQAVLGKLWGLSSNRCAFEGCTNRLVSGSVSGDFKKIIGHICHIYGLSEDGPRGKKGLTTKEKNSYENLILMCRHHHGIVDDFEGDYDADTLKLWKQQHEALAISNTPEAIKQEGYARKHAFFVEASDDKIEEELKIVRQGRYIDGFSAIDRAQALAAQVEDALSAGHDAVRARALAWCARILSGPETREKATVLLQTSKRLANTAEAQIAEQFFLAKEEKPKALEALAKMNTPDARSAMLRIVTNADGQQAALTWAKAAGLTIDSFEAEGKFVYLINAVLSKDWDTALENASSVTERDLDECPALIHAVAMSKLLATVAPEFRSVVSTQVPFDADTFPLDSTPEGLKKRQEARALFIRVSDFARKIGVADASNIASDYALWLGLNDPATRAEALKELRESMSDVKASLRRVNLAIRCNIKVDIKTIEERIDQNIALSGGQGTADAAFARFSLAFVNKTPKEIVDYIAKHRDQLDAHLQKSSIVMLEVETLARAGMLEAAREKLRENERDLGDREKAGLSRIIAELSGADPIESRRKLYEERKDLVSLHTLVNALEEAKLPQELRPYAEAMFRRTKSLEACERVAKCLNDAGEYADLAVFMAANKDLVEQSQFLKMLDAWTLYREGNYPGAKAAMARLTNDIGTANIRRLRVNIAIATGAWDDLLAFANEVWAGRDQLEASDLLEAASLSVAVNGPHSKDLVVAATLKEPDNPQVLASAYFLATSAGWEHDAEVAGWIAKAAHTSGEDGPIKMVSLVELSKMQPDWNKRVSSVSDQLKAGQVPAFTAAQALNRSLLDFYLTPSLLNPLESDVRRRNIVFAFSGARGSVKAGDYKTIALDFAALLVLSQLGLLKKIISHFEVVIPNTTLGWLFQEKQKVKFHQPSRVKDAAALKALLANKTLLPLSTDGSADDVLAREVGLGLAAMLTAAKSRSTAGRKVLVIHGAPIHRVGSLMLEEADVSGYAAYLASPFAVLERLRKSAALLSDEDEQAKNYLSTQVKEWPSEPTIGDDTDVYLDGLAISNLRGAGLLPILKKAGISFYVEKSEIEEADGLLALESLGSDQLEAIEKLRAVLAEAIANGSVRALRPGNLDEEDENLLKLHPTYGVLSFTGVANALVVDDRFINRHATMTTPDGKSSAVVTTLDLLDFCVSNSHITQDQFYLFRNRLRQWGYQLIAVTDDELQYHLKSATYEVDGAFIETSALRVIRESLLRARMSKILQVPLEMPFVQQSLGAFVRAMKAKWISGTVEEAKALGAYVLNITDLRAWAPSVQPGNERIFATVGYAGHVLSIAHPPEGSSAEQREKYLEWIDEQIIQPIKDYQPDIFQEVVAQFKRICLDAADRTTSELEKELDKNG